MKKWLLLVTFFNCCVAMAQTDAAVYTNYTTAEKRLATHRNIINNSITKNLSLPLNAETEENWEDAFYSMALINYRTLWIDNRIKLAFDSIQYRSDEFQRSLIEMAVTVYPKKFSDEMYTINSFTKNAKVYAMSAEYLWRQDSNNLILTSPSYLFDGDTAKTNTILNTLFQSSEQKRVKDITALIKKITALNYLPGNTIVYSFQRSNRNYPGIVLVRDGKGNFITDEKGNIFSVQQLARSVSNMPCYLTNGNTPQGIFRMNGFDVSKSMAIGPTTNIQLMMPYETTPQFFLKDSTITDTVWTEELYKKLLPEGWKDDNALYQSYYASKIGRTEIIAHGTTVDPEFYSNQPYYPHTPTQGCLCTKEIWDATGKRSESDQQQLADAVKKAGSADGYLIVIEIDDNEKAVTLDDVFPFLKGDKKN